MRWLQIQLHEFHQTFDQPIVERPQQPSEERVALRMSLIAEEFMELLTACGAHPTDMLSLSDRIEAIIGSLNGPFDMVEAADALTDIDYVVEGTRLEFGIDGAGIADEVHRANMAKAGPGSWRRDDGKIMKPDGWTPPDIAGELRRQGWAG